MRKQLLKSLLVAVALITGTLYANAETVKFDFAENEWNLSIVTSTLDAKNAWITDAVEKNNVSIVFKWGTSTSNRPYYLNNSGTKQVRAVKGNVFKVFAPEGKTITKIEFEKGSYFNLSADGLTETTWEGNSPMVKFTATGTNWIYSITVTYEDWNGNTVMPATEEETIVLNFADYLSYNDEDGLQADLNITQAGEDGTESRLYAYIPKTTDPTASQNKAYYVSSSYRLRAFNGTAVFKVDPDKVIKKLTFAGSTWNAANTINGTVCATRAAANALVYDGNECNLTFGGQTVISTVTVVLADKTINAPEVVLDETSTDAVENFNCANVTVKRNITADEWAAVSFPFAMNAATVKANFGDDVEVAEFTNADGKTLTVFFQTNANVAMEAGVPYLIKTSKDVTEVKAQNATLTNTTTPVTFSPFKFVPTFTQATLNEGWIYVAHNNMLKEAQEGGASINGFRAYFEFPVITLEEEVYEEEFGAKTYILNVDGQTTGIKAIDKLTNDNSAIYDLQGRRVATPTRGLYIVNGKKVVVK